MHGRSQRFESAYLHSPINIRVELLSSIPQAKLKFSNYLEAFKLDCWRKVASQNLENCIATEKA